ncbi:MAG: hypothetical protein HIU84_05240 [Acidobacteria bacterium]|nr:hypothetical protein [Acidobacteriota bacterium]
MEIEDSLAILDFERGHSDFENQQGVIMYKHQLTRVTKSLTLASLSAVLVAGIAGVEVAGASPEHHSTGAHAQGSVGTWFNLKGHGEHGRDHQHGHFDVHGQITAVSATSLTVQGEHGSPVVLTITPTTTFMVGSSTATASALAVGERVLVQVSPTAPNTATQITVAAPKAVHGQITAVSATSLTVQGEHGSPVVLTITPTTTFMVGSSTATASALAVGERVLVQVSPTAPNTATQITVALVRAEGLVSAVSPTALTLTRGEGWTISVALSPTTTFTSNTTPVTISALTTGVRVEVQGTVGTNHTINATNVNIVNSKVNVNGHANWRYVNVK